MKTSFALVRLIRVAFALFLGPTALFAQGPLNPPAGTPAPMMKSLQQIEPRIDLQSNPPAVGVITNDQNYHFVINQPGSYYLSSNLGVTKPNGIQINVEGVTLQLEGFEISRASGSGGYGIEIAFTAHRAAVTRGSIRGFAYGIRSLEGPTGGSARGSAFNHLAVSNCTVVGILAGEGTSLEACRAYDNGDGLHSSTASTLINCIARKNTGAGIIVEAGSTLFNCTASGNTGNGFVLPGSSSVMKGCTAIGNSGPFGISANQNVSLIDCVASGNSSSGAISAGIQTGASSVVINCTAANNSSSAALTATTGMGFSLGPGSMIRGCVASTNKGDGIRLQDNGTARENQCDGNGNGVGDGAGIYAAGADNRIEGNNVTNNDRGIQTASSGNLIIKNSASGNTGTGPLPAPNYKISGSNFLGTVVATEAAMNASTNPNINLSF